MSSSGSGQSGVGLRAGRERRSTGHLIHVAAGLEWSGLSYELAQLGRKTIPLR